MRFSRLGNTGLVVSRLALGTWTFGSGPMRLKPVQKVTEQSAADALVGMAIDNGVNLFGSADVYCGAEELLGKALGSRRHDVVVATKAGMRIISPESARPQELLRAGLSRRHLLDSIEGSLLRLGTDYVDVFLVHLPDRYAPLEETVDALDRIVRDGKARYVGFSNWPAWLAQQALGIQRSRCLQSFVAAELYYSLACRDIETELVPSCVDSGIGVLAWGPLAGGLLTGRYGTGGGGTGRLTEFNLMPTPENLAGRVLDELRRLADATGHSMGQIAIAWVMSRPAVSSVFLGASTAEQLAENLQAAGIALPDTQALDEASSPPETYPNNLIRQCYHFDNAIERALDSGL